MYLHVLGTSTLSLLQGSFWNYSDSVVIFVSPFKVVRYNF